MPPTRVYLQIRSFLIAIKSHYRVKLLRFITDEEKKKVRKDSFLLAPSESTTMEEVWMITNADPFPSRPNINISIRFHRQITIPIELVKSAFPSQWAKVNFRTTPWAYEFMNILSSFNYGNWRSNDQYFTRHELPFFSFSGPRKSIGSSRMATKKMGEVRAIVNGTLLL